MADITISDLELAPALTDDMVLPVENTTDTYAATLAMLRRLINKTFVEVENADFNALTDDGFYQCTGTPTNSPVAGAINWTLQVSAESGVVVQRAFSLDDNFANLYIRRWNGVTWTAWLNIGKGALDNKANVSNTVTTDTNQTISGSKRFTKPSSGMSIELISDTNQQTVPTSDETNYLVLYRNTTYTKGDGINGWVNTTRTADGRTRSTLNVRRFLEGDSEQIINYVSAEITADGIPVSYTRTPPAFVTGSEIVTAGWFRQAGCTARTVIETYRNGTNWYRIWSDGWIEQGGVWSGVNINTSDSRNLLKAFTNTDYTCILQPNTGSFNNNGVHYVVSKTTSTTTISGYGTSNANLMWYACGY